MRDADAEVDVELGREIGSRVGGGRICGPSSMVYCEIEGTLLGIGLMEVLMGDRFGVRSRIPLGLGRYLRWMLVDKENRLIVGPTGSKLRGMYPPTM